MTGNRSWPRVERSGAAGRVSDDRVGTASQSAVGAAGVPSSAPRRDVGAEDRSKGDRGSVTVEAAVGLTAIVLVLSMCLAGIGCLITALRVTDAAGEAARLAARGDSAGARAAVAALAPAGSVLSLSGDGDTLTATVTVGPLGGWLPGIHIGASAVAAVQDGADAGDVGR